MLNRLGDSLQTDLPYIVERVDVSIHFLEILSLPIHPHIEHIHRDTMNGLAIRWLVWSSKSGA